MTLFDLSGKTAIVTGASRGLGLAALPRGDLVLEPRLLGLGLGGVGRLRLLLRVERGPADGGHGERQRDRREQAEDDEEQDARDVRLGEGQHLGAGAKPQFCTVGPGRHVKHVDPKIRNCLTTPSCMAPPRDTHS